MLNVKVLNQWLTIKPVYIFITLLVLTIFPKTYSIEFSPYGDGHLYQNYYTEKMANGPDRISNSHYDGVFWNLGPTGIRALLTDRNNEIKINAEGIQFQVRYVFANSPAHNLVQVDDIIIGVNGKNLVLPTALAIGNTEGLMDLFWILVMPLKKVKQIEMGFYRLFFFAAEMNEPSMCNLIAKVLSLLHFHTIAKNLNNFIQKP